MSVMVAPINVGRDTPYRHIPQVLALTANHTLILDGTPAANQSMLLSSDVQVSADAARDLRWPLASTRLSGMKVWVRTTGSFNVTHKDSTGATTICVTTPGSLTCISYTASGAPVALAVSGSGGVNPWPDGTAALPGLPKQSDLDTGYYGPGANQIGMSLGGVASGVWAGGAPSYAAATDTAGADVYYYTASGGGTATAARLGAGFYTRAGAGSTGSGAVTAGAGGVRSDAAGPGGSSSGTGNGGAGGAWSGSGGAGGSKTGTGAGAGGQGGPATVGGGDGGNTASTSTGAAGLGATATLRGGAGGSATGAGSTGNGAAGGGAYRTAGTGGNSIGGTGGAGGWLKDSGGDGGTTAGTADAGAGSWYTLDCGAGGAKTGTGAGSGGAGGYSTRTLGAGGDTATTGAGAGGAGGSFTDVAGVGGAASAGTANGGTGGGSAVTCGNGGTSAGGTGGNGGDWSGTAGNGGNGVTSGAAGRAKLIAGSAGTGGNVNGGGVWLQAGAGVGTGVGGCIVVRGTGPVPLLELATTSTLTDADTTLSVAETRSLFHTITPTAGRAKTTLTAAQLVAAFPDCQVGSVFIFHVLVLAAFAVTYTAGAGVTTVGNMAPNNVPAIFAYVFTNVTGGAEAVTLRRLS